MQARPVQVRREPAVQAEPVQAEPVQAEPVQARPVQAPPVQPGQEPAVRIAPGASVPDAVQAEPVQAPPVQAPLRRADGAPVQGSRPARCPVPRQEAPR